MGGGIPQARCMRLRQGPRRRQKLAVSEHLSGKGRRGGRKEKKTLRLGLWPSKALGRPWKRSHEGLSLYGFLKGRKEKGLRGEGELSVVGEKAISAWEPEQGVTRVQCGQVLPPIYPSPVFRLPLSQGLT